MANPFARGTTVICSVSVYDEDGVLTSPSTSMKITIKDSVGLVKANNVSMTNDSTGKYHYDFATVTADSIGKYRVDYWATSGTRVSSYTDYFDLS